ncbi:MAG TPA: phage portal protein [Clostridia bacterium]|nr:phage portal protein [Clostridia bacterium]
MAGRIRSAWKVLTQRQPSDSLPGRWIPTDSGVTIGEDSAMRFATVQACIRVLSEDIASLPLHVYKRLPNGGKERARDHPLYRLVHDQPNPDMTTSAMRKAMMVNALLYGNAYAFIEFDRAGRVRALWPLVSSGVERFRTANGETQYRIDGKTYRQSEIFHVMGLTFDGLVGLSPIAYARETIGLGLAAEQFGKQFFKNGTHLGGTVSLPEGKTLSDPSFERLKGQFNEMYKGLQRAFGVVILEQGAKYTPFGIPPEDAQFLETRKYQRSDIAAIFRVPPHLVGDLERATFSNIEHQDISYLQRSLFPWLVGWEQEFARKILSEREQSRFLIEHDTDGFLRGDKLSRMSAYATAIQNHVMVPNEARERENLNPLPGGDEFYSPANMPKTAGQTGQNPDAAKPKE